MKFTAKLSARAAKGLDSLDENVRSRLLERIEALTENPYDSRVSAKLTGKGDLRKSRVGGWRIIFTVDNTNHELFIVTVERRGQVYRRI